MRIRFTREIFVGTRTHASGDVAELTDEQGKRVVASGSGVPVVAEQAIETAELAGGTETTTIPTARKNKGK